MIYHSECKGQIYLDLSPFFFPIGRVTILPHKNSIFVTGIEMFERRTPSKEISFYCPNCECFVKVDGIISQCMGCRQKLSVDKIFIPVESGGTYCMSCANKYFSSEKKIPLDVGINKVQIA